jgi:hypothetical protein
MFTYAVFILKAEATCRKDGGHGRKRPRSEPIGVKRDCLGKQSLFIVRTIRNTQIHPVGRELSSCLIENTLYLRYRAHPVNAV